MNVYLRVDVNIMAAALLGSILFIAYNRLDKRVMLNKAYMKVSFVVLIQLLFETATCIINRQPIHGLILVSYILHICLFAIAPILTYYGYILIRNIIMPNKPIPKKLHMILLVPIIINAICTIISAKYHFVFYINEANVYHRGTYFLAFSLITYCYIVLSFALILCKRKQIMQQDFIPLLLFSIFCTSGGIIQSVFYGPLVMWSSTAFSLVVIYALLQQRMVQMDDLTGAWSRGSFDYYITNRFIQNINEKIGLIFCDIDDLKKINDRYGHIEGDKAIKAVTKIIKSAIHKYDILVRLSGDEFLIIIENESKEVLDKVLERIKNAFIEFNNNSGKKYELDCSFGADILDLSEWKIEEFLKHIDSLMYENKKIKKQAKEKQ